MIVIKVANGYDTEQVAEQVKENVKDVEVITIFLVADRQTRMLRLRSRFDSNYDKEEYANNNSKYREDLREGVYERIYNDSSIFKTLFSS